MRELKLISREKKASSKYLKKLHKSNSAIFIIQTEAIIKKKLMSKFTPSLI